MPTDRPRHQVTETPMVARAIDRAARRWPGEPRAKLLLRLVDAGSAAIEHEDELAARRQRQAVLVSSGKYADAFGPDHLVDLRRDWPE